MTLFRKKTFPKQIDCFDFGLLFSLKCASHLYRYCWINVNVFAREKKISFRELFCGGHQLRHRHCRNIAQGVQKTGDTTEQGRRGGILRVKINLGSNFHEKSS